jgi:hypothetical protein
MVSFVAPYLHIGPDPPSTLYEQYQIGPHIYDSEGVRVDDFEIEDVPVVELLRASPDEALLYRNMVSCRDSYRRGVGVNP